MQVERGLFQIAMTQKKLNGSQIGAVLQRVYDKTAPQRVRMDLISESCSCGFLPSTAQLTLVVIGCLPVCQRLPGNSQTFDGQRREHQGIALRDVSTSETCVLVKPLSMARSQTRSEDITMCNGPSIW